MMSSKSLNRVPSGTARTWACPFLFWSGFSILRSNVRETCVSWFLLSKKCLRNAARSGRHFPIRLCNKSHSGWRRRIWGLCPCHGHRLITSRCVDLWFSFFPKTEGEFEKVEHLYQISKLRLSIDRFPFSHLRQLNFRQKRSGRNLVSYISIRCSAATVRNSVLNAVSHRTDEWSTAWFTAYRALADVLGLLGEILDFP